MPSFIEIGQELFEINDIISHTNAHRHIHADNDIFSGELNIVCTWFGFTFTSLQFLRVLIWGALRVHLTQNRENKKKTLAKKTHLQY